MPYINMCVELEAIGAAGCCSVRAPIGFCPNNTFRGSARRRCRVGW